MEEEEEEMGVAGNRDISTEKECPLTFCIKAFLDPLMLP